MTTIERDAPAAARSLNRLPIGSKATIFGLGLFATAGLILLVGAIVSGDLDFLVLYLILTVVPIVLAFLVARFRGAWPLVVTTLVMIVSLVMNGPIIAEGLRYPRSFVDFPPSIIGLFGILIPLVASVAALVARRRGDRRSAATPVERTAALATVGVLAALTLMVVVLNLTGRESVSAEARAGAFPVRMKATRFEQERIEGRAGQPTRIVVRNSDPGVHTFTLLGQDVEVTINPGDERLIELPALPAGEYPFVCNVFGHETVMKGVLVVQ